MDAHICGPDVHVTLSRRNLLTLLHKLDVTGSLRTLVKQANGGLAVVTAVEDAEAYKDANPGTMSAETEAFLKQHRC